MTQSSTRPRIGVTEQRRGRPFMPFFNWLSLWLAGARAVRLSAPLDPDALETLDGLIIGGGDDIGAELYGGMPAPNVKIDPERDAMEFEALDHAERMDIPVLGLCRGAQMLNVFYGGTLHMDIYEVYVEAPRMRTVLARKCVTLSPGTRLHELVGMDEVMVNSLHHQAVDRLGAGLRASAHGPHNVIQAIESTRDKDSPVFRMGVQWHPEFLFYRKAHRRLFGGFVDAVLAARRRKSQAAPEHRA